MPSTEKNTENEVCQESARIVPNGNTGKTRGEVREDSRNDAEHRNSDAEPNTEKPGADRDGREVKDEKRVLKTGNVVKPPHEGHKKETGDYDQASSQHC